MRGRGTDPARLWTVALPLLAAPWAFHAATWSLVEPKEATRHTIEIRDFAFHPSRMEVTTGDTVVWVNRDAVPHTATVENGAWDSGSIAASGSWAHPVQERESIPYDCAFHPSMRGMLVVR